MNNFAGRSQWLVLRVVMLQFAAAALVGVSFWIFRGAQAASAGFAGGAIVAVGSIFFGWRMFAPGIAPAATLYRAMFAAESLKWLWYVFALWAALARGKLAPLPLLTGLIVAQLAFFGLAVAKRG